ncbi:MAG: phosphate regulon sensor histidine kinase PhoR [Gemmatimonadaceae bacterium]
MAQATLIADRWTAGTDPVVLARDLGRSLGQRVTLIDPGGHVVGDSDIEEQALPRLESYAARPEIIEARRGGAGSARRAGPSPGEQELHVAVRAPLGFARVSIPTRSFDAVVAAAERDVIAAGLVAALAAAVFAVAFARSVAGPVVELRNVAQAIAAGDLGRRPPIAAPGEVGDLANSLHAMAVQLSQRLDTMRADEALMTALIESLNEGVVAVDARGTVVRVNDSARRLLGVKGAVPFPAELLPRDATLRRALMDARDGRPTSEAELRVGERTLILTARPLPAGGSVLALYDLTAVRRLETVRRDFVANVSHELKTPLTVISGFAETLADDDPPAEDRRRFVDTILTNARRMQRVVDDLLDLSRIESGGWKPRPAWNDVEQITADTFAAVRDTATAKKLALDLQIDPAARRVYADATALRQILGNLVENAVRNTLAGSVVVVTRPGPLDVTRGSWVGVRDTGVGIAPEHLPRIFERFYRVDAARAREGGGTGLGLAIVRHLVEAHGGRVDAQSIPGQGTTIGAFFPDPPGHTGD